MDNILELAFQEGEKALKECIPNPVLFYSADLEGNQLDKGTVEEEGNCGGAYIDGISGNSEIVKFFKKNGVRQGNYDYTLPNGTYISKGVYKGYTLHANTRKLYNGQSAEKYEAFYNAYVKVLKEKGDVKCYVKTYLT